MMAFPGLGKTSKRERAIVLHGSIEGLTPDEALAAVLPTCGWAFEYQERGRIIVTAQAK
jgi:hypothetical protein